MNAQIVLSYGRLIIPLELRKKFEIKKGTRVYFIEEKDGIKIIPITAKLIKRNIGFMGTKGKLLKALKKEKDSKFYE